MMKIKSITIKLLTTIILFSVSINLKAQEYSNAISTADNIEYTYFYKHLEFLSSDELKGRDTGSEGYAKAADYVANEFKANGLKPFGDDGTYFQKVPLIKRSFIKSSINFQVENNEDKVIGVYGENYSLSINFECDQVKEDQELVFVGYGNISSKDSINDYEGIDVKGKTVIVVMGAPKNVEMRGAYDPFSKVTNAVKQGAKGIILFFPNSNIFQGMIFKQMHGFLKEPTVELADTSMGKSMFNFDLTTAAFVKKELVKDIFKINGLKLKKELKKIAKGNFASRSLDSKLSVAYNINVENFSCKNVVAMLPGTDPNLKSEYVVVGGHLDHVGVGEEVKGDSIYNGMWDNATGAAAILTISKAYNEMNEKPRRSLVFVCYTGEEKGLLGSEYFAQRNDISDGKIVANVNIDMLGGLFESTDVIPLGYSHSNLSEAIDFSAKSLDFIIDDNKKMENMFIQRSDQISYIKIGAPVINVANGFNAVNPKIDGEKFDEKWMKKYYHSPFDDINQEFSSEAFLKAIKLNFLTLYYTTNVIEEIKWNDESWLYKKYVLEE